MKTSELTGAALDWAVGMAEGYELSLYGVDPSIRARVPGLGVHAPWAPRKYWNQGGPIIEREFIELTTTNRSNDELWEALGRGFGEDCPTGHGTTPLIAAMRCYVASKLGCEVEIPPELTSYQ